MHALGLYADEGVERPGVWCRVQRRATPCFSNSPAAPSTLTWGGPDAGDDRARPRRTRAPRMLWRGCRPRSVFSDWHFRALQAFRPCTLAFCHGPRRFQHPGCCLQQDLRDAAIDPATIARVASDRSAMAENYTALCGKELDVMQAFEPPRVAGRNRLRRHGYCMQQAPEAHRLHVLYRDTNQGRRTHRDAFLAVTRALAKMQTWLYAHHRQGTRRGRRSLLSRCAAGTCSLIRCNVISMQACGRVRVAMSRRGFERLGFEFSFRRRPRRRPVFEDCVDTRLS